jgi:2-hydroxycyclohexanecarboxyl-CoA dehydrogenase
MKVKDKIAIITGGGRGMGEAHSLLLASEGATVITIDKNGPNALAVAERVRAAGGKAEGYELDITKGPEVRKLVQQVGEKYGRIDILVNNAGYDEVKIFSDSDEAHWDWMIDLNYKGHLHVTHAALPYLKKSGNGKVVFISSDAARVGSTGEAVYAGAKAALIGFGKTLAREEARNGIRVNIICPGLTNTPQFRANLEDEHKGKIMRSVQRWIPLKRFGEPEEIAKAVLFMVSDDSSFITGQVLSVSGGLTMVS